MSTYRDLFEVHLRYTEWVREKSQVVHQYVRNIGVTGSGVEVEVRALLRSILPYRFRVTTGYIASAVNRSREPSVSPQVDVVIVDTLVPHTLWLIDQSQGIEIVPQESVVGVIEVKRTLTFDSLREAARQLREIVSKSGIRKDDGTHYMPGGMQLGAGLTGPYRGNPLLGVVSLVEDDGFRASARDAVTTALDELGADGSGPLLLDFVLSLSGTFVGTATPGTGDYATLLERPAPSSWLAESSSTGTQARVALAHGLGFILAYIEKTCGRSPAIDAYFFNRSIL